METIYFELHDRSYRVKVEIPEHPSGLCIVVPSGQMGKFDQEGAEGERELYSHLFSLLPTQGIGVAQPDMPLRKRLDLPADEKHLCERGYLLKKTLQLPLLSHFPPERIVFLGVSLGGYVVLNNLHSRYAGAILVGCVIEEKISWTEPVRNIHLIYGSHDYIAYGDESGELIPIAPEEYSKKCVQLLKESGVVNVSCTILDGFSHTLTPRVDTTEKPEEKIMNLIKKIICVPHCSKKIPSSGREAHLGSVRYPQN
ncbi:MULTISPECIES: alpha/beta hydrolase [Geobacillus]|uniref:alpha/beta hydrolase n=1 Tax=Geobacillus TaxID=129337 RepID=UPI0005CCF86A|nr:MULTISPECIES: alpha/beta hydrolase [Geobacillus]TWG25021.1 putative esterase [Geobacillus sp. C56-T2]